MKMFYFDPNDYEETYVVMAKDKYLAYDAVVKYLEKESEDCEHIKGIRSKTEYLLWKEHSADNLPRQYRIREFEESEVLEGEIS